MFGPVTPECFQLLHGAICSLDYVSKMTWESAVPMIVAADKYLLNDIKDECLRTLEKWYRDECSLLIAFV